MDTHSTRPKPKITVEDFEDLRLEYDDAVKAHAKATRELAEAQQAMQHGCPHPLIAVVQANHSEGLICDRHEFRVCRQCGYAEEGWGSGYYHLKQQDVPVLPQDTARGYVIGRVQTQDDLDKVRDLARNGPKP